MKYQIKYLLLLMCILTANTNLYSQKIVFAQDCPYKNNPFSKKIMGAYIVEDTVLDEKLIIYSGAKTVNFYHTDGNWKLKKMIELPFEKKSAFADDNFKVISYSHKDNVWNLIAKISTNVHTAERVDMNAGVYQVAGIVFEDKKANWYPHSFTDGNNSYNIYVNRSDGLSFASIDANQAIKTFPLDFSTRLPVNKTRKLDPVKDIFANMEEINNNRYQSLYFTRKKSQFYIQPDIFTMIVSDEEPYTELMVFDKKTGKRIRTELFSTEALLPENIKTDGVNTNALIYNGKLWMVTAYKNGGVVAAFDIETKKLLTSFTYDDKTVPATAVYGPVLYKLKPDIKTYATEKLTDTDMDNFCKEMYKERPCIYIIPVNDNEYAVNIASYAIESFLGHSSTTGDRVRGGATFHSDPGIYNSLALGFIFSKSTLALQTKKSSFNEINKPIFGKNFSKTAVDYKTSNEEPEYRDKRAYKINDQTSNNKVYTIYYYDRQLKISVKQTSVNPPATD